MSTIQLEAISKFYQEETPILSDVNLTIEQNDFFVLVGPSGSGKSTLLRIIAGLDQQNSGTLTIFGQDATQQSPKERKLSMVFQNYALFPHLTVKDNILFGLSDQGIAQKEQEERLSRAVLLTNLEKYLDRRPKALSGGQRQRVALARAIASQQKLILMDEPLSNLDAKLRERMRTQIKQLQRELGITIIYVTHDQTEAMTMGDQIAILNDGVIQQVGHPLDLYNQPKNTFVASFIGTPQINLLTLSRQNNQLVNEGQTIAIPAPQFETPLDTIIIGLRPENLTITDAASHITGNILNVEQLGNETLVTIAVLEDIIRVKVPGQRDLSINHPIHLQVDTTKIHYFDVNSTNRLQVTEEN